MQVRYAVGTHGEMLQPEGSHEKEKKVCKLEGRSSLGCELSNFDSES